MFENSPIKGLDTGIFPEGTQRFRDLIGSSRRISCRRSPSVSSIRTTSAPVRISHFDPDYVNGPDIPPVNHLDFYMTIPKAPMPTNGYPIAVYGHTLGGDGSESWTHFDARHPHADHGDCDLGRGLRPARHSLLNFFVFNNLATLRENFAKRSRTSAR